MFRLSWEELLLIVSAAFSFGCVVGILAELWFCEPRAEREIMDAALVHIESDCFDAAADLASRNGLKLEREPDGYRLTHVATGWNLLAKPPRDSHLRGKIQHAKPWPKRLELPRFWNLVNLVEAAVEAGSP